MDLYIFYIKYRCIVLIIMCFYDKKETIFYDRHFDQRNTSYILQNIYHWKLQTLYFLMV
jgi:hypothetical protein